MEEEGQLEYDGILKKILIKPELKKDIENFLKISGVNDHTMFPDLDGLQNT